MAEEMTPDERQFLREKISELRKKLLDLSNRNPLLNFRHSERARTHIRIIDELPDFLFGALLNGQELSFKSLPEPGDEPPDEQTEDFQIAFREATRTDEQYLQEIAGLIDRDDSFDDLARIERNLKNRVRESLGMPTVTEPRQLSNAEWARQNGLTPNYDMPEPPDDETGLAERHSDEYIQTLLKPKELLHKLSGLKSYINTDISETGVNTFYVAFGFLERYDSDDSNKPLLAPLLLLQLDPLRENKTEEGQVKFTIQASGEGPEFNLPLAEKLKEFGLQLPILDGNDTPESYMKKVERLIRNQNRWRVRRFITIGRFQFSRLVMYHDLNPERWPQESSIEHNEIIADLLVGRREKATNAPDIYDIDKDSQVEEVAPILIREADSSQHSAIVDALKGNNLVIKGPPGTGKSQTITNLIANALYKNQRVLFIAEKMAALNVVHKRLQDAGLQDFCLELHSTKTKLKNIKDDLAVTIENRKTVQKPQNFTNRLNELRETRSKLREYYDAISQSVGESGKTICEVLWGEQSRRGIADELPAAVKNFRIENALCLGGQRIESLRDELRQLAHLEARNNEYGQGQHPWSGVQVQNVTSLRISEIIQAFEECLFCLQALELKIEVIRREFDWVENQSINEWKKFHKNCLEITALADSQIEFDLLRRLNSQNVLDSSKELIRRLREYDSCVTELRAYINDPEVCLDSVGELEEMYQVARELGLAECNSEEILERISSQEQKIKELQNAFRSFQFIVQRILGPMENRLTLGGLRAVLKAIECSSSIDNDSLFFRQGQVAREDSRPFIERAIRRQEELEARREKLQERFDLNFNYSDQEIEGAIYHLSNKNFLSYLKPQFYKARKLIKRISKDNEKVPDKEAVHYLKEINDFNRSISEFKENESFRRVAGDLFDGINTEFPKLLKVNGWAIRVKQTFSDPNPLNEKIVRFLLEGAVSEIESVKEVASAGHVCMLLDYVEQIRNPGLTQYIAGIKSACKKMRRLAKFLQSNQATPELTFQRVNDLINDSMRNALEQKAHIRENRSAYEENLGPVFLGIQTNRELLENTIKLSTYIKAIGIPEGDIPRLCGPEIFSQVRNILSAFKNNVLPELVRAENSLNTIQEIGELNLEEYVGYQALQEAPLSRWKMKIQNSINNEEALNAQIAFRTFLKESQSKPYSGLLERINQEGLNYQNTAEIFEYLYFRTLADRVLEENPLLDLQQPFDPENIREQFRKLDSQNIELNCQELAFKLAQVQPPEGICRGRVSEYTEMGLIRHQALSERPKSIPIRRLMNRAGRALQALKPCFLMSPLSVAQYIEPRSLEFDLVIIDEASQMRPEDAVGAIGRSRRIVVVGDPKQLPPTDFFRQSLRDEDYEEEDRIDNESILDLAMGRYQPARDLRWHYRSRHESLIAFSNQHFYDNRLIVFPSPEGREESFGVNYNYIGGRYNSSCNIDEVKAVLEAAQKFMRKHPDKSLGIATMNSQQRDLIDEEMYRLFLDDEMANAYRQKWDKTLEPFFVKNLESVQGDERDVIFISTVYGPSQEGGTVAQRFGPINGRFGHRRLNVLFTRAKHGLVLFTSLRPDDIRISETSALGLKAFKGYLEYASNGVLNIGDLTGREPDSDFELYVKERLEGIGCEVVPQVGVNGYFIDLGVKHPDYPFGFLVGVECDGATYHSSRSARDRDRIRQAVLEELGWEIYRIWSRDWFHNPNAEFDKLKSFIDLALERKTATREQREQERLDRIVELETFVQKDLADERVDEQQELFQEGVDLSRGCSETTGNNTVELNDTVSYRFADDSAQTERAVTIVSTQGDVEAGKINRYSAIGRALLDSRLDEEVEVDLPDGSRIILITNIVKHHGNN